MIKGGFYLKARCIQESEIAHAPPHVREIWDWLIMKANHAPKKISGRIIERGQVLTTYNDIREALYWKAGFRKCRYSKWQCETAMKVLRAATMVTTMKTTRGLLVTILNYDYYQDISNYENHTERHNGHHNETTMKPHHKQELKEYKEKKNIYTSEFLEFWETYPKKVGKGAAWSAWKKCNGSRPANEILIPKIENQKTWQGWREGYIPNPATYLNQARWDDEEPPPKSGGSPNDPVETARQKLFGDK